MKKQMVILKTESRLIQQMTARILPALLALTLSASAQEHRVVTGHVPAAVAQLQPVGALPGTNQLRLVIGLPLHNPTELDNLLNELHDPASTNYHQWLTPEQFSQRFGPTEAEYQQVIHFAESSGLKVTGLCSNRMLVDVEAPVTNIETAFHVGLHSYPHPREARNFYAPDAEPTVATNVPILHISGLDNYTLPHRLGGSPKVVPLNTNSITAYATGSGAGGNFMGNDFRAAYVPGVTNRGGGQYIAIVDVGGPYYPLDVYMYETNAGLSTNSIITNIITTYTAFWTNALSTTTIVDEGEEVLDIDMALSMAPDAVIMNYEGDAHDVFNRIATDNKAKQMTLSYGFGIDASIIQTFQQFLAQGQAMSQASGDGGADLDGGTGLTGNPYATVVGGVSLTTSSAGGAWASDVTWGGSGGGISGYGIPTWQQGINMSANLGSTSYRNYPDVSMPADNIFTVYKNGTVIGGTGGTSAASPLWAGFMALVNQQAAVLGKSAVGFPNPAIYALGKGTYATYTNCFHDITTGNTVNSQNASRFYATSGYDLCTGWGSPRGSNTITALVGVGTNDFMFFPTPDKFSLVAGASANSTITLTRLNGLTGSATFTITGLPAGIAAVISPASTTNTTALSVSTTTNTMPGTYTATLTGTLGSLVHTSTVSVVVQAPIPGAVQVGLSSYYNRTGLYSDGRTFSAGVDGSYAAYSANQLGTKLSWNGLVFNLGPSNANDVVYCAGQTIALPAGNFNTLQLLGTGVQGSQTAQTFIVTYTDNSTTTNTQSFSDWCGSQSYAGESVAITMSYRNLNGGGSQSLSVYVYGYTLSLDPTKTVKSITLPGNSDVILLAAMLANEPITVPLSTYYNRAGMYTDGTTFTNPATGGLDGGGYAYSATLLGGSQTWSNVLFNFGTANVTNVISCTNQVITLPAGNYSAVRLLAAAVQGSLASQAFTVTYTNNLTSSFVQGISDWCSPQNYSGESKAVITGHRNIKDGTKDGTAAYLYGYSFKLNSARVTQSIKLPSNAYVMVAAISLVPNWPPTFALNPFTEPAITAGQNYSVNISTNASDLNGDSLTFAKVSGPSWLSVSTSGVITGRPLSTNVGVNSFVVSATDTGSLSNTATMNITVSPAPALVPSFAGGATNFSLSWNGGIAPYQVQMSTNLADTNWINVGVAISSNSLSITPTNPAVFYRIVGQ